MENNYRNFDPSCINTVGEAELEKALFGQAVPGEHETASIYFIVCRTGIEQLRADGKIFVHELRDPVDCVFNASQWFGKFRTGGQSQIIVPGRYELLVNPSKKQVFLKEAENARYYGNGNLQLDKDMLTKVLSTDVGSEGLKEIVYSVCRDYQYGHTLELWRQGP